MRFPRLTMRRREALEAYALAMPWILGFFCFTLFPFVASLALSFTEYTVLNPPQWIGLANYEKFIQDDYIADALRVTFVFAATSVPLHIIGGLIIAFLLNNDLPGLKIMRTVYYMPVVASGAAVGLLWWMLLDPNFGVFNSLLRLVGIQGPNWLGDPQTALLSLVIMSSWSVGSSMILYLANLQSIPTYLYEAATLDGASWWTKIFSISLPLLTPTIFFTITTGLIGAFQSFTFAYVMTDGGPLRSTLFYALLLYRQAFQSLRMGYASAMAWILFVIVLVITIVQVRLANRWVYYEGEKAR